MLLNMKSEYKSSAWNLSETEIYQRLDTRIIDA